MADVDSKQLSKKNRLRNYWALVSPAKRFWTIFSIAAFALLVVGLIAWFIFLTLNATSDDNANPKDNSVSLQKTVCSKELIQKSAAFINSKDTLSLYPVTEEIRTMQDYSSDQNCLYILLQYNFLNNISKGNDELLSSYEKVFTALDPSFGLRALSIVEIRDRVKTLKIFQEQADNNRKASEAYRNLETYSEPTE